MRRVWVTYCALAFFLSWLGAYVWLMVLTQPR